MAGGGDSRFLEALDRTQSKKDAGFRNNWSFANAKESDDIVEKDEINLLTIEDDDAVNSNASEQKASQLRSRTVHGTGDPCRTYEKRGKQPYLRGGKGNATGMNMLGASKKLGENAQSIVHPQGTIVQGRIFHHINTPQTVLKTAAQSLERRERKEYPPHVQKVDVDDIRLSERPEDMQSTEDDSEMESEPVLRRKVQPMRNSSFHTCLSKTESTHQLEPAQHCTSCVKENKTKTRCQSCGDAQRLCGQSTSSSESPSSLARPSIHQSVKVLNAKNFYGQASKKTTMDSVLINDALRWKQNPANGKIGLCVDASFSKITKNSKLRSSRLAETSDTIILSSDDEDHVSTGSTSRIESISPRPADSACSSPVPSSGKVEAALRENRLVDNKHSSPAEPDPPLPRKARMKDQFGNSVATTPIKRRKMSELPSESTNMLQYAVKPCESMILVCRNLRIGTLYRIIKEPVVFCVDYIKIILEAANVESGSEELILTTSELTKCEWCSARKLPVVYFQSTPFLCHKLRSQFKMSRENETGWYDCKATSIGEQYIVLIFDRPLEAHEIACFEKMLSEVGEKQSIPNFFSKISFDEANRRLVAFTKHGSETPPLTSTPKDHITRSVTSESQMKLRNTTAHLPFFDDEEEGDTHTVFVGPIEKLIVYPPPPAKGGISVTNEDLHCLTEGEFLNDVIIDFYLKYLILEKLREKADKIHIFSSFFYKRLNQRERRNLQDTANLTLQQRRHGRVKTWTRHVDIFQKDFIFVPLNEAAHWFLAVICFPGLKEPMYYPNKSYQETSRPSTPVAQPDGNRTSAPSAESPSCLQSSSSKSPPKKLSSKKQSLPSDDTSSGTEDSDGPGNKRRHSLRKNDQGLQESDGSQKSPFPQTDCSTKNVNGIANECKTPLKQADDLHRIQISYSDSPDDLKKSEEELIDSSDQDNLDESSDEGGLADDNFTSEAGKWHLKPSFCKQPCILLMDSLRGPSRSNVVKTLREYLEVEWEVKKGSKRSFSKDYMKGSNPRVPQQNNFSDCGVFVLQYVESFFENPIQSFDLPMNLTDWFPQQRMKTKREEIRKLILGLQELQSKDKTGQRDLSITQPTPPEGTEACDSV
ncbi:sentrin-specific protease 6 isoform 2-T2 [Anomaloglossus baeobatrachus]|uniref:sentrin-specific protease 6 isoform X2 n=1 Tax=Anomaloglossus baeobatrachus TaxID=238106 RepID=UPI003F4F4428